MYTLSSCARVTDSCTQAQDHVIPSLANQEALNLAPGSSGREDDSGQWAMQMPHCLKVEVSSTVNECAKFPPR